MSQTKTGTSTIRVAVIDDHPAVRTGIRETVNDTMGLDVVAESGSVDEAIQLIEDEQPDVVVLDLSLEDGHGFQLLENIQARFPETRVVVFSVYDEKAYARRAMQTGASGYVMKNAPLDELITAIRRVEKDEMYLSTKMVSRILKDVVDGPTDSAHFPIDELTDRELQVFQMLGQGVTLNEIADRLNLARKTVETYRRRAKEKLGFEKASELMAHAIQWTDAQRGGEDERE